MSTPFSYYLFHVPTQKRYYGIRHSRDSHPSQLWTTYFTSSKIVRQLIEEYGINSFIVEVRKTFTDSKSAVLWEHKVLRRLNAAGRDDWINRHNGGTKFRAPLQHTEQTKERIRQKMRARVFTEEHKKRISVASLADRKRRVAEGWHMPPEGVARRANEKRGIPRSPEMVKKMRASKTGTHRLYLSCGKFVMV